MMNIRDGRPARAQPVERAVIMTGDRLDRIVVSLTVLHAQSQLMNRRIERGQAIEGDGLRQAMARMDTAIRDLVAEVRVLTMATSPTEQLDDPAPVLRDEPGTGS